MSAGHEIEVYRHAVEDGVASLRLQGRFRQPDWRCARYVDRFDNGGSVFGDLRGLGSPKPAP